MTDADPPVLYALGDAVAVITLNRPDHLNALTYDMLTAIPRLLGRAADDGARAILLTGRGRAFCSGAALSGNSEPRPLDLSESVETYYNPMAKAFAASPLPIITAINGPAVGAGASLALWGDIIVAARSSYLLLAFANIGLVPDAGASWLIAKSVGRVKALEMALLAERLPAEAALAAGLVTRVVDDEQLMPTAQALAAKIAAMPTLAMGLIRRQIMAGLEASLNATLEMEREHQSRAGFSDDFAEGVAAFKEKRKPVFTGR
jgi:2-(1,2-epoxy-1,2-dihydrophenyl)acetyl-CoA isomerase